MDRASDSGSEGWGFESLPAYQKIQTPFGVWFFCCRWDSNHYIPQSGGLWAAPAGRRRTLQFSKGKLQRVPSGLPRHRKAQTDGSPGRAGGQCPQPISHAGVPPVAMRTGIFCKSLLPLQCPVSAASGRKKPAIHTKRRHDCPKRQSWRFFQIYSFP